MPRSKNQNLQSIAAKPVLSGSAKAKNRKLKAALDLKLAKQSERFFKLPQDIKSGNDEELANYSRDHHSSEEPQLSEQCENAVIEFEKMDDSSTGSQTENPESESAPTNCNSSQGLGDTSGINMMDESSITGGQGTSAAVTPNDVGTSQEPNQSFLASFRHGDPSTWNRPLSSEEKELLLSKCPMQTRLLRYPKTGKVAFNPRNYIAKETNLKREWLLYSKTTNSLFCFPCCLFSTKLNVCSPWTNFGIGNKGFSGYAHQSRDINMHERSEQHFNSTIAWKDFIRRCETGKTKNEAHRQKRIQEVSFWKQVLRGILDAIIFLSKNNLAFLGSSFKLGDPNCGNFLSLVELLSKYYTALADHVRRITSKSSRTSYMSAKIQNEFIELTASRVRQEILQEVREAKYYSMMFDATPDISHKEQISQIIRILKLSETGCTIKEYFLAFIHFDCKTGEEISEIIIKTLEDQDLDLGNCRGQGYDNGANMSGAYKGVQARILLKNSLATFIPCAVHSLNLVGQNAASKNLAGKLLLGQIQNLFNFFSASTSRWNTLTTYVKKKKKKCQSATRWSSRANAVCALVEEFKGVYEALSELATADTSNTVTCAEANAHMDLIGNYKFLLGISVWNLLLGRINVCSKLLQGENCTVDDASKHLEGLVNWLSDFKANGYPTAMSTANKIANENEIDVKSGFTARKTRGRLPARFRKDTEAEVNLSPTDQFKLEFFDPVMNAILKEFSSRFEAIKSCQMNFDFLWGSKLSNLASNELEESAKSLAMTYEKDFSMDSFVKEIGFLKSAVTPFLENIELHQTTPIDIINILVKHGLRQQFPSIVVALQIFLTLPVTVASNERAFSKLKIIKNYKRSCMGQQRLSDLSILSVEHSMLNTICFDEMINDFALKKTRRVTI